jgi:thymidylate kinase
MLTTRKAPKVLIFFGPDGSGKTTQADMMVTDLKKNGMKVSKLWLRSLHTLAFVISRVAMQVLGLSSVYEFRTKYAHSKVFRSFWFGIEFISILPLIYWKLQIPLLKGESIVAERFVIDWIVSLSYVSRNESMVNGKLAKLALKFIPKNAELVFIDASYDVIQSRGRREDTKEFIEFQRKLYSKIAKDLNAFVIDTSDKSLEEVHTLIYDHTSENYP